MYVLGRNDGNNVMFKRCVWGNPKAPRFSIARDKNVLYTLKSTSCH